MVNICRTGLLKLNFEIVPKKRIFRFLPKISAGHGWSWKIFLANFQTLGPLGCQGWVVIPQNVKKSQNHCTLSVQPCQTKHWPLLTRRGISDHLVAFWDGKPTHCPLPFSMNCKSFLLIQQLLYLVLYTKRPTIVFFSGPTKPLPSYG